MAPAMEVEEEFTAEGDFTAADFTAVADFMEEGFAAAVGVPGFTGPTAIPSAIMITLLVTTWAATWCDSGSTRDMAGASVTWKFANKAVCFRPGEPLWPAQGIPCPLLERTGGARYASPQ
jgi:hypothetical protein